MHLLINWVTDIIMFLLLGTIIEMMIPHNQFKKYLQTVIGLLLLLLLLQPILTLLQTDVTKQLEDAVGALESDEQLLAKSKQKMESQLIDIQANQNAYIWSEIKLQMIKEVNPTLEAQFSMQVRDIEMEETRKDEHHLNVIVSEAEKSTDTQEPITMESNPKKMNKGKRLTDKHPMKRYLAEMWEVEESNITLYLEGGAK